MPDIQRFLFCAGAALVMGVLTGSGCAHERGEVGEENEEEEAAPPGPAPDRTAGLVGYAVNLNFEAGLSGKGRPEGWGGGGEGYERVLETKEPHAGRFAAKTTRVGGPKDGSPDFGSWTQCIVPEHFKGKRVRYSGWLRTRGAEGSGAALWMRVDGPDNRAVSFDNMKGRSVKGTTPWTRYEVVLDVPETAQGICFGWLLAGPGTAWADDLKFEFVDESTPVTDMNSR